MSPALADACWLLPGSEAGQLPCRYNDKLLVLVQTVLDEVAAFKVQEDRFKACCCCIAHCKDEAGHASTQFLPRSLTCLWVSGWHGQEHHPSVREALKGVLAGVQVIKAHLTKQYKNHKFQQPFHHAL